MTSAFWRYTAFQIPGWAIAAVGGWVVHQRFDVPWWVASGVLVVWVAKDYALYPFLRFAYESDPRTPLERLIGQPGTTSADLTPRGYVRVRGELWRAREDANGTVRSGEPIRVVATEGSTLVVRRIE